MDIKPRVLRKYVRQNGKCPYDEWFEGLRDLKAKAVIDARLIRLRKGILARIQEEIRYDQKNKGL